MARSIRAGGHAIAATDTPVRINNSDSIGFLPGGLNGTDLDTGRVLALLAGDRHIKKAVFGHQGRIVKGGGIHDIHAILLFHPQDPDPMDLRVARLIVFSHAGIHTAATTYTAREIESIDKLNIGQRRIGSQTCRLAILGGQIFFQPGQ